VEERQRTLIRASQEALPAEDSDGGIDPKWLLTATSYIVGLIAVFFLLGLNQQTAYQHSGLFAF
jgi:hypothetical protein